MNEHRRRRRQQLLETAEIENGEPVVLQPEPEAAPAQDQPETTPAQEESAQKTAPQTDVSEMAARLLARAREAWPHVVNAAKNAGLLLLGLLALLGSKIAVGADAAHRALQKHTSVPQKPARDIEHASEPTAEDPHGAAARRKQREQLHREHIRWGLMTVFAIIALVSLIMMAQVMIRSIRTRMLNDELSAMRAELTEQAEEIVDEPQAETTPEFVVFTGEETLQAQAQPEATAQPEASPEPETQQAQSSSVSQVKKPIVKNTQYHVSSGTPLPQMAALYEENRDLIGWLEIPEVIDLPVMYRDNEYYLKRDFYKQKNESGTLFLDENHRFSELTQNLLLHGHNMKDGTMFGRLLQYHTDINYLKNNPFVNFDTLWKEEKYVIFAVLRVSLDVRSEDYFNYFSYPRFESDEEFNAYIRRLQLRSEYSIPLDVDPSDALLTLSTCLDEDRLVIVCRRFREGETRTQLRQIVHLASWQ